MQNRKRALCLLLALILVMGMLASCGKDTSMLEALELRSLCWAVGAPLPDASAFVPNMPAGVSARFAQNYQFHDVGVYDLMIILSNENGAEVSRNVQFTLLVDNTPPVLEGVKDIGTYLSASISYKKNVTVRDNCDGEIDLQIDTSRVNLFAVGSYPVVYTATDLAGNRTIVEIKVNVYEYEITEEMLYARLDPIISQIITPQMTKEEQCRAVYRYVFNSVAYISTSDKTDWIRSAYFGLEDGEGDCYTYYALSKAFLDRLGIENMCIQRSASASAQLGETHYWNYVNIGSSEAPQWYHFDTTHLNDRNYTGKLDLITEEQLQRYNNFLRPSAERGAFYDYDHTGYPISASRIITNSIQIP